MKYDHKSAPHIHITSEQGTKGESFSSRLPSPLQKLLLSPPFFQITADALTSLLGFCAFIYIRFYTGVFPSVEAPELPLLLSAGIAVTGFWILFFWFVGLYKNWYVRSPFDEFFAVCRNTFLGIVGAMVLILLDDSGGTSATFSRLIIFVYGGLMCTAVCVGRFAARSLQRSLREKKILRVPTLLIGCPKQLHKLVDSLYKSPAFGYHPLGVITVDKSSEIEWNKLCQSYPYLPLHVGNINTLEEAIKEHSPREVIISQENPDHEYLLEITEILERHKIKVKIIPDLYEIFSGQARTMQIYGVPLIEVSPRLMKPWEEVAKRMLDIFVSITVLTLGFPVWLLMGIAIRLDSPGPAFFIQRRVGKDRKEFMMYKFRSMRTDSEAKGPQWTKVNDPRVTAFGRFIRKTHVDEIPQFINVLKGEMSLVGPRPEQPYYVEKFTEQIPYYPRRLKVRPGITGWYQIKYVTYEETIEEIRSRLRFDFFYIENMSFKLDLEILVRTVIRMVKGRGQA
jgi:exopolysaccharide biosynthesis polyprenyl glycosylphosphotransferase